LEGPDLSSLDAPFLKEEVRKAINLRLGDKAPDPDGFTKVVSKKCWETIKEDYLRVIHSFGSPQSANFH
jgi:hypothetical protein